MLLCLLLVFRCYRGGVLLTAAALSLLVALVLPLLLVVRL